MFINLNNAFYNKRHQLKSHFYSQDNIHLSPSGIKGLLGAINRNIEIVKDFNNSVLYRHKPQNDRQSKQRSFSWKGKNGKTDINFLIPVTKTVVINVA